MAKYFVVAYQTYPQVNDPFRGFITSFKGDYPTEEEMDDLIESVSSRVGDELRYDRKIISLQRLAD